jgi:hypothetical protein
MEQAIMVGFSISAQNLRARLRHFGKTLILLMVGIALVTPRPDERALAAGALFNKIASVLSQVGVDPDTIEMARYAIDRPAYAGSVFSHAATQDYPFFALVGAVKLARGQNIPGFTQAKCELPMTVIDLVFGKADTMIDDAKGKQDTNTVVNGAKAYAADWAKAQTAQGKQAAIDQLSENIPYFGEIKTICSFAFETNFKAERNLQLVVKSTVGDIRKAYMAFKDGDYVTGVSTLLTLGVSGEAACSFVDTAVDSSLIGKTPVLGDLAKGLCSGFVGKIIDGAKGLIKGGVGLVESGVSTAWDLGKEGACAVYSLIGSGCSSAPPPPDAGTLAVNGAKNWCAPYGGLKAMQINSGGVGGMRRDPVQSGGPTAQSVNDVKDYAFNCNDGSMCRKRPGGVVQCATATEMAQAKEQRRQLLQQELASKLVPWRKAFSSEWQPQCQKGDTVCLNHVGGLTFVADSEVRANAASPNASTYMMASYLPFQKAAQSAQVEINESRFRTLPGVWSSNLDSYWKARCQDQYCRTMIDEVKTAITSSVALKHKNAPAQPYSAMSPLFAAGDKAARDFVAESEKKAGDANKAATLSQSEGWALEAQNAWQLKCADAPCKAEIAGLAGKMKIYARLLQTGKPLTAPATIKQEALSEYGPKFNAAVLAAAGRTGQTTPVVRVPPVGRPPVLRLPPR